MWRRFTPRVGVRTALPLLGAVMAIPVPAMAAPGEASTTGVATAQIVEPISVVAVSDLQFGGIAAAAGTGGSVEIDPVSGTVTYLGVSGSVCSAANCDPAPALFDVRGVADRQYHVSLPASAIAYAETGSGAGLQVVELQSSSGNLPGIDQRGLLDGDGQDSLTVGGRLIVPPATPPGRYSAQVPVVVSYN
ncbi:MAG: DUF4402 domain-containing protein [Sphingomonadales bacterium]|nr:MAG: DUF4402 domain-containing protein [Sphingomonadales bacterium]